MTGESHVENLKAGTGGAGFQNPATEILFMAGFEIRDVTSIKGEVNSFAIVRGGAGTDYGDRAPFAALYGGDGVATDAPGGHAKVIGGRGDIANKGGHAYLRGGLGITGAGGDGGNAYVQGGFNPLGNGGNAYIQGGTASASSGAAGKVTIETFDSAGSFAGPGIILRAGAGGGTGTQVGGPISITAGNGGGAGGDGGHAYMTAGDTSTGGFADDGGNLYFDSGNALNTNGTGGSMYWETGTGGSSQGGSGKMTWTIPNTSNGQAGDFKFVGGQSTTNGRGSDFTVNAGNTLVGDGGDIVFNPGNGQGLGDHGHTLLNKIVAKQVSSGGTFTTSQFLNPANGSFQHFTIGAAATLTLTPAAVRTGVFVEMVVEITNGGNAGATVTWSSSVEWASGAAPTLTAAGKDLLRFVTRDGGVNWMGYVLALDLS